MNCSLYRCAHDVHNYDTQQHRAGQIISLYQTITTAQMLSVGGEGVRETAKPSKIKSRSRSGRNLSISVRLKQLSLQSVKHCCHKGLTNTTKLIKCSIYNFLSIFNRICWHKHKHTHTAAVQCQSRKFTSNINNF